MKIARKLINKNCSGSEYKFTDNRGFMRVPQIKKGRVQANKMVMLDFLPKRPFW